MGSSDHQALTCCPVSTCALFVGTRLALHVSWSMLCEAHSGNSWEFCLLCLLGLLGHEMCPREQHCLVSLSQLTWALWRMQGGGAPIVNNNTPGGDISNSNCGGTISSNGGAQSTCG